MTTNRETKYDSIIKDAVLRHFAELLTDFGPFGWLWIRAQIWQESRMDPKAVSPVGAAGLMQLMPATDLEIDGEIDGVDDPTGNINDGVLYLAQQYRHLAEIPAHCERIRFALASYNGGRGNVNFALVLARAAEGLPGSFKRWRMGGSLPGQWQLWQHAAVFMADDRAPRMDYKQMWDYVAKIESRYNHYQREALNGQGQALHVGH